MFVTEHPNRWLINMSRAEMDALRRLLNAGFLLLEGEASDGLWSSFSPGEQRIIGRWQKRDPMQPTGPRPHQRRRKPKSEAALGDGLSSVA